MIDLNSQIFSVVLFYFSYLTEFHKMFCIIVLLIIRNIRLINYSGIFFLDSSVIWDGTVVEKNEYPRPLLNPQQIIL